MLISHMDSFPLQVVAFEEESQSTQFQKNQKNFGSPVTPVHTVDNWTPSLVRAVLSSYRNEDPFLPEQQRKAPLSAIEHSMGVMPNGYSVKCLSYTQETGQNSKTGPCDDTVHLESTHQLDATTVNNGTGNSSRSRTAFSLNNEEEAPNLMASLTLRRERPITRHSNIFTTDATIARGYLQNGKAWVLETPPPRPGREKEPLTCDMPTESTNKAQPFLVNLTATSCVSAAACGRSSSRNECSDSDDCQAPRRGSSCAAYERCLPEYQPVETRDRASEQGCKHKETTIAQHYFDEQNHSSPKNVWVERGDHRDGILPVDSLSQNNSNNKQDTSDNKTDDQPATTALYGKESPRVVAGLATQQGLTTDGAVIVSGATGLVTVVQPEPMNETPQVASGCLTNSPLPCCIVTQSRPITSERIKKSNASTGLGVNDSSDPNFEPISNRTASRRSAQSPPDRLIGLGNRNHTGDWMFQASDPVQRPHCPDTSQWDSTLLDDQWALSSFSSSSSSADCARDWRIMQQQQEGLPQHPPPLVLRNHFSEASGDSNECDSLQGGIKKIVLHEGGSPASSTSSSTSSTASSSRRRLQQRKSLIGSASHEAKCPPDCRNSFFVSNNALELLAAGNSGASAQISSAKDVQLSALYSTDAEQTKSPEYPFDKGIQHERLDATYPAINNLATDNTFKTATARREPSFLLDHHIPSYPAFCDNHATKFPLLCSGSLRFHNQREYASSQFHDNHHLLPMQGGLESVGCQASQRSSAINEGGLSSVHGGHYTGSTRTADAHSKQTLTTTSVAPHAKPESLSAGGSPPPTGGHHLLSSGGAAQLTLIVNVPPTTTRQDLLNAFKIFGQVLMPTVVCRRETRHPKKEWTATAGYAFVLFESKGAAQAALAATEAGSVVIRGTSVKATWAKKDSFRTKPANTNRFTLRYFDDRSTHTEDGCPKTTHESSPPPSLGSDRKFSSHSMGVQSDNGMPFTMDQLNPLRNAQNNHRCADVRPQRQDIAKTLSSQQQHVFIPQQASRPFAATAASSSSSPSTAFQLQQGHGYSTAPLLPFRMSAPVSVTAPPTMATTSKPKILDWLTSPEQPLPGKPYQGEAVCGPLSSSQYFASFGANNIMNTSSPSLHQSLYDDFFSNHSTKTTNTMVCNGNRAAPSSHSATSALPWKELSHGAASIQCFTDERAANRYPPPVCHPFPSSTKPSVSHVSTDGETETEFLTSFRKLCASLGPRGDASQQPPQTTHNRSATRPLWASAAIDWADTANECFRAPTATNNNNISARHTSDAAGVTGSSTVIIAPSNGKLTNGNHLHNKMFSDAVPHLIMENERSSTLHAPKACDQSHYHFNGRTISDVLNNISCYPAFDGFSSSFSKALAANDSAVRAPLSHFNKPSVMEA